MAAEPFRGVFWGVVESADPVDDEQLVKKCDSLGLPVPELKKMDPFARHRRPAPHENNHFKSVQERYDDWDWHKNHGPPKENAQLSEDLHFMLRCLYDKLPLDRVTKHTKSSRTEDQFVRNYAIKFGVMARELAAVDKINDVERLNLSQAQDVLHAWLKSKVWANGNSFQWQGFHMTAEEITTATKKAHRSWLAGYVL